MKPSIFFSNSFEDCDEKDSGKKVQEQLDIGKTMADSC